MENIQVSCQSSQEWTSQQVHPKVKNPRATYQTLQASVSMLNVRVHDSTIRKRLNKYGLFGRAAGESLFSLKRTWQHSWKRKESRCCNGPVKVQTSSWLKCCGGTLRELCINQCCKPQWTEAMLERRVGQNSFTTMWETDNVTQKTITSTDCC